MLLVFSVDLKGWKYCFNNIPIETLQKSLDSFEQSKQL